MDMNEISKEVFNNYKIRRTRKQKDRFIEFIKQKFPSVIVEEDVYYKKNKNLIFGDIENAKCIIVSHYDTKNLLKSFEIKHLSHSSNITLVIILYVLVILMGVIAGIIGYKTNHLQIAYYVELAILLIIVFSFIIPSRSTNNDNTSGVIGLIELVEKTKYDRVAFVLFDNKEANRQGSRSFNIKHSKLLENKLVINIDSIADGDYICVIPNKKAFEKYRYRIENSFNSNNDIVKHSLSVKYNSDHIGCPVYILITVVNKGKHGYYIKNVNKKYYTKQQEKNIRQVIKKVFNLVQNCI